jgi:D-sedoheptulose 7-phosphate isomerase
MVEAMVRKGDILVAISTSGNSSNIIKAIDKANNLGAKTIGMTGKDGGIMAGKVHLLLNVPSSDTPRIQESHILMGHILCQLVEENIF